MSLSGFAIDIVIYRQATKDYDGHLLRLRSTARFAFKVFE